MKNILLFGLLLFSLSDCLCQTISSTHQNYINGDGLNWYLNGTGNGPLLMLRQHSGLGGANNRRGALGWMDNNGNRFEYLTWDDAGRFGIGNQNPLFPLHILGSSTIGVKYQSTAHAYMQVDAAIGSQAGYYFHKNALQKWGVYVGGNSDDLRFFDDGADRVTFSKGGNVGVGTTNPLWNLDIRGTIAAMNAGGDGALGTAILFGHASYPLTQNHRIRASTSASAPLNILQIETSNGTVGQYNESQLVLKGNGSVGIGTSSPSQRLDVFGYIRSINGFVGDNGLKLWADNSSIIPGLFLSPNGNIGLGSVNPTEKLSIYGVNNSLPAIISLESSREDAQGAEVGTLKVKNSTVDIAGISVGRASGSYTGYMRFLVKPENNLPLIEAFRIKENGNVGIGTSNPVGKLDVVGDILVSNGNYISLSSSHPSFTNLRRDNGLLLENNTFKVILNDAGNFGIGTINPTERLSVDGNIKAKKLIVTQSGWPDYVFEPDYSLKSISDIKKFIKEYKHLPDMPKASEIETNGLNIGEMQASLLKKLEEMTLYIIDLKEEIEFLKKKIRRK